MPRVGTHIILDGKGVQYNFANCNIVQVQDDLSAIIMSHNMTILHNSFHDFRNPKGAFTGIFLLGESHMSIHTFPEEGYIAIDIFVCNMYRDMSLQARDIIDECITYFNIKFPKISEINR